MTARNRWFALLALAMVAACDSDEANGFKGPSGSGSEECLATMGWDSATSAACTACLHAECAAAWQSMSQVCAGDPSARCVADAGASWTALNFCECMVHLPSGCGAAVGNVYACFVSECSSACGGGTGGAAGAAGAAGKAGSAGKAGAGGTKSLDGGKD